METHTSWSQQVPSVQLLLLERITKIRGGMAKFLLQPALIFWVLVWTLMELLWVLPMQRKAHLKTQIYFGVLMLNIWYKKYLRGNYSVPEGTERTSPAALFLKWWKKCQSSEAVPKCLGLIETLTGFVNSGSKEEGKVVPNLGVIRQNLPSCSLGNEGKLLSLPQQRHFEQWMNWPAARILCFT